MAEKEKPTTSSQQADKIIERQTADNEEAVDLIRLLTAKLNLEPSQKDDAKEKVIDDLSFDGLIKHWKTKGFKNIVTMVGAGISTSAGIPDFRTPGTGLYHNLQKYNLPYEMAIFDISFFRKNPKPFFTLAKELYPGNFNPTPSHYFVRLLHDKGVLKRHYTQNIDTLERVAGIPVEKLVEAHGTFYNNHCVKCHKAYEKEWVKKLVFEDKIPKCTKCKNVIKPDIVFFGENLPDNFYKLPQEDFECCDLLIVMGTSLEVHPFAMLFHDAGPNTPRFIINRTNIIDYDDETNTRDIVYLGDCDDAVWSICKGMGWTQELKDLMEREVEILKKQNSEILRTESSKSSAEDVKIKTTQIKDVSENEEEKK